MTDAELDAIYSEFLIFYNNIVPDMEHEPIRFQYYVKLLKIAKAYNIPVREPHTLQDHSAVTCGDSNCVMCGNPRKFFKDPTVQEKSFDQKQLWIE